MTHQPVALPLFAKSGYAAITSIIVILVVIVLVGIATSYLSLGNAMMSLGQSKGEGTRSLVESCIEDALLRYNKTNVLPTSITTPLGTCTLTIDIQTGSAATFTTSATLGNNSKSIQVSSTRTGSVAVVNWIQTN